MDSNNYPCGLNSCILKVIFQSKHVLLQDQELQYETNCAMIWHSESEYPIITAVIETVEPLLERLAVKFALEHGIIEAIFQGNLEVVIKAIKNAETSLSHFGHIV